MTPLDMCLLLLFAHFMFDWAMQPEWIGTNKDRFWQIMIAHCMIYTGGCIGVMIYLGCQQITLWSAIVFTSHYAIDTWKCRYATKENFPTWHLYVDQVLHILILFLFVFC